MLKTDVIHSYISLLVLTLNVLLQYTGVSQTDN